MNYKSELTVLSHIPKDLLLTPATELFGVLSGPTLIHLDGRRKSAVFISVLLHGNEHTGWDAVRTLLQQYQNSELPRALSLFIGNIDAARKNQRFLDGQQDFNRMWGGRDVLASPLMQAVMDEMKNRELFLSVDIHNNTGKNPHYACVNKTEKDFIYLASLFSRTVVYFVKPESVQSMAFSKFCPSVTVECGLSGDERGTEHALQFIQACLQLSEFPTADQAVKDTILYHTVAIAKISDRYEIGFNQSECDISFIEDIEYYNFKELPKGTVLGKVKSSLDIPVDVVNDFGENVSSEYFEISNDTILTKKPIIPAMITKDISVIHKDCFCYLMEEYQIAL